MGESASDGNRVLRSDSDTAVSTASDAGSRPRMSNKRHKRPPWLAVGAAWWIAVISVLNIFLAFRSVGEGNRVQDQVESQLRQLCAISAANIVAATETPPTTEFGRIQLNNRRILFTNLKCDPALLTSG